LQNQYRIEAERKWDRARRRAFWARLRAHLGSKPTALLDFNDVAQRLRLRNTRYRGVEMIPLDHIVGSMGRYHDFTGTFLPTREEMGERWRRVAAISLDPNKSLPPIEVYKVGAWYFVRDGHHRVSVAQQMGVRLIEAAVWEYSDLNPSSTEGIETLLVEAEERQFMEQTRLHELRPGHDIRLTSPGGYDEMLCQIDYHQHALQKIDETEISYEEAVTAWYDMLYESTVQLIKQSGVLELFPNRTAADFFVWTMQHNQELTERYSRPAFIGDAIKDFRTQNVRTLAWWLWCELRRRVLGR
jgi:hypothetical protein